MWTAVVLGSFIVAMVALYGGWAWHAVGHGAALWPFVVGFPLAYLAFPFLFTCVWVTLGWWLRAPRPGEVELGLRDRLRLFGGEFASLSLSAPKMVLYRFLVRDPPPAPAALPVLLLHGVGCNAGVWTGLKHHLETEALGPVYALSYGPPLAPIASFAPQVAAKIAQIVADTGATRVAIVCHSMGGLVARAYLRRYGGGHVQRLITIGTPHAGSLHAWMMHGQSLADMRPRSEFLEAINASSDHLDGVPMVSLWSWHDSMVTPQTSSSVDWADNIVLSGIAHNALLNNREVWRCVAEELRKARAAIATDAPAGVRPR